MALTYNYTGSGDGDKLRENLGDTEPRTMAFPNELLDRWLDDAGGDLDLAAAAAYDWLAGNPEALKKKYGLTRNYEADKLREYINLALETAQRFREKARPSLGTHDDGFEVSGHLNTMRKRKRV